LHPDTAAAAAVTNAHFPKHGSLLQEGLTQVLHPDTAAAAAAAAAVHPAHFPKHGSLLQEGLVQVLHPDTAAAAAAVHPAHFPKHGSLLQEGLVQVLHPDTAAAAAVPPRPAPTSSLPPWPAGSFTIASASCLLLPVTAALRMLHSMEIYTVHSTQHEEQHGTSIARNAMHHLLFCSTTCHTP
jgi:hypothetical protein